jgi:hypothetical protein
MKKNEKKGKIEKIVKCGEWLFLFHVLIGYPFLLFMGDIEMAKSGTGPFLWLCTVDGEFVWPWVIYLRAILHCFLVGWILFFRKSLKDNPSGSDKSKKTKTRNRFWLRFVFYILLLLYIELIIFMGR